MDASNQHMRNAVALAYQAGTGAPKVVATGKGMIADQIIALAKENGVYVHQSTELVSLLMDVELDQSIPPNLYRSVAELLAWLYKIDAAVPPSRKAKPTNKP